LVADIGVTMSACRPMPMSRWLWKKNSRPGQRS
jgi:hypothetical protein